MIEGSPSLLSGPSRLSVYGYDQKGEPQAQQLVQIEPQNVIVFYRNQFQSASTIKISKPLSVEGPLRFHLRTTNRNAYLVSQSSGEMNPGQTTQYINIIIKEQTPLEQCLHDKFQLLVTIPNKPPIQRKFKVIIDYKKEIAKTRDKQLGRLQLQSKTSSSAVLTTNSIMGHPLAMAKRSMMKNSHLVNYLLEGGESERINVKQQLDDVVKSVEERRHRLEYLEKEIQKNQSRKRFMLYVALVAIILAFFIGITLKKAVLVGWQMSQHYFFHNQVQQN